MASSSSMTNTLEGPPDRVIQAARFCWVGAKLARTEGCRLSEAHNLRGRTERWNGRCEIPCRRVSLGGEKRIEYLVRLTALKMMCCEIGAKLRLSYSSRRKFPRTDKSFFRGHFGGDRYPCRAGDPLDANIRGREYCIDARQDTGSSSKTCDRPDYRTTVSERGPKRADLKQPGS